MVILPEAVMKSDPVGLASPLRPLIIIVTAIRIPPRFNPPLASFTSIDKLRPLAVSREKALTP